MEPGRRPFDYGDDRDGVAVCSGKPNEQLHDRNFRRRCLPTPSLTFEFRPPNSTCPVSLGWGWRMLSVWVSWELRLEGLVVGGGGGDGAASQREWLPLPLGNGAIPSTPLPRPTHSWRKNPAYQLPQFNRARCRSICFRTCTGAVPPSTLRALSEPFKVSTSNTSGPMLELKACSDSNGNSLKSTPR